MRTEDTDGLIRAGALDELERRARAALEADPNDGEAQDALLKWGYESHRQREVVLHLAELARAPAATPSTILRAAGAADATGDEAGRVELFALATTRYPEAPMVMLARADDARDAGDLDIALSIAKDLTVRAPSPDTFGKLAAVELLAGNADGALATIDRALELGPTRAEHWSLALFIAQATDRVSNEQRLERARRFGRLFGEPENLCVGKQRAPLAGRRLRVGFLSSDLREHAVTRFLLKVLEAHDRDRVELFTYGVSKRIDHLTKRYAEISRYRAVAGRSHRLIAERIAQDELDVLVELNGHTANTALRAVTYRPAPVMVAYLGYPDTTGLTCFNARLTDSVADPPGRSDELHTEPLVRLPCAWSFDRAPSVRVSKPSTPVRFAAFHALAKVTAPVLRAWARILREIDGATISLCLRTGRAEGAKERVIREIAEAGADPRRILWQPWKPKHEDLLADYDASTAALDTFPYNGTTTTCDALSRGVPVVTIAGDRHAARVSSSLLTECGATELIAANVDEYIELAVRLARDPGFREAIAAKVQAGFARSRLCHPDQMARDLEATYAELAARSTAASARWLTAGTSTRHPFPPSISELATWHAIEQQAPLASAWFPASVAEEDSVVDALASPWSHAVELAAARGVARTRAKAFDRPASSSEINAARDAFVGLEGVTWMNVGYEGAAALMRSSEGPVVVIVPNGPQLAALLESAPPAWGCFVQHPSLGWLVPARGRLGPSTTSALLVAPLALDRLGGRGSLVASPVPAREVPREIAPDRIASEWARLVFARAGHVDPPEPSAPVAFALASRDAARTAAERVSLLDKAAALSFRAATGQGATLLDRVTAGRLLADVGARSEAVDLLTPPDASLAEPDSPMPAFLPAMPRYEAMEPKTFSPWLEAQLIEATVKLSAPSSFFHPDAVGALLTRFAKLGFDDPEMDRRLGLLLARTGRLD